jgi:ABC-type antimicrobial peptide transport system permease subunit
MVLATFGITALLLALLGVYGVLAYSVLLRQQEFGIRIALGSGRRALVKLVVMQASVPVMGGITAGLGLAFLGVRYVSSLLYQTSTADPLVIAATILLLLAAALLAAWLPARRAASTDPMRALRTE